MGKSWRIQNETTHQDLRTIALSAAIDMDNIIHGEKSCFSEDIITLTDFLGKLLANFDKFVRHEMDYDPDQLQLFQSICIRLFRKQMQKRADLSEIFRQEILSPMEAINPDNIPEQAILEKLRDFCNTLVGILTLYSQPHVLCNHCFV